MGKVIPFKGGGVPPDNIILEKPLQFRWADWKGGHAILVVNTEARKFEQHRLEVITRGHSHIAFVPNHLSITNGLEYTLNALLRYRREPEKMKEVYYLAGLMECLINVPQKVLRTAMVRTYYQTLLALKKRLAVHWHGNARRFLFPLFPVHYDQHAFMNQLATAQTLKELYHKIQEGVEEQFLILGSEYVFYIPRPPDKTVHPNPD